jgi:hypothetical protein
VVREAPARAFDHLGGAAAQSLREAGRGENDGITLIAISGISKEKDRKRVLNVFDYHLPKPVGIGALHDVLKTPPPGEPERNRVTRIRSRR